MDHFGAEIRQLRCFLIREIGNYDRVRHAARVGTEHAVDVSPDRDRISAQQGRKDRCREITAVSFESGGNAILS